MNIRSTRLLQLPSLVLAAALQILPLARAALPITQSAANIIVILFRWGASAAAALGGVQAVSGASTVITNPLTARGTNGQSFSLRLTTAPDQAHYWQATGVPPGLALTGTAGSALWKIEGTPSQSGVFAVGLIAKDQIDSSASRTVTATLTLTVVNSDVSSPPSILGQPSSLTRAEGQTATFSVTASGAAPLVYQWRHAGTSLPGKTASTLTLAGLTLGDAGTYDVVVTNSFGSVTSTVATLTVTNAAVIPPLGQFNGVFFNSNAVDAGSAGFFNAKVGTVGVFSGSLRMGSKKLPFRGQFDATGRALVSIPRVGLSSVTVDMTVSGGRIAGEVSDGGWTSALRADLAVFHAATNPAVNLAGMYTVLIPGVAPEADGPVGDGFGAVKILTTGVAAMSGSLADGSKLVVKSPLSASGEWPVYAPLYKGGVGALVGWLRVRPSVNVDLDGDVYWARPAGPWTKFDTNGFALASAVAGSAYVAPGTNRMFEATSATLTFSGGNLSEPFTNVVMVGPSARLTNASPNKLTVTLTPATGLLKGVVSHPVSGLPIKFQGALLQRQALGGGYFLGTNEVGRVTLEP